MKTLLRNGLSVCLSWLASFAWVWLLSGPLSTTAAGAELVLGVQGKTDYQLVLPDQSPSPNVGECLHQTARLAQAAFAANGFTLPITAESKRDPAKPSIYLGDTAFARTHGIEVAQLSGWGYIFKAIGPDLIIAGRDEPAPAKSTNRRRPVWDRMGTAKGVADFLRQYAGTRFLYPDLPPNTSIAGAAKIDFLQSPAFEFLPTPAIAVPADLDVVKTPLLEFQTAYPARGGFFDIANNCFPLVDTIFGGHTYERAIPRDQYADSHPEYFALIGGERTAHGTGNAQYCISNPAVQELFYQDLIRTIDRGFQGVDLGQPDGFRPCQCEQCAKLYDTGNDWGEKLWILHRNLAARVEKARPGKQVTMMSYIQTALPPKTFQTFPANTRILLTGTNEEDIAPWRGHQVPAGFSSYLYNWCPNLGTRYTPMRTPLFVESQARRLTRNQFRSIYRDGPGHLFGLEGPVYYTLGRMFDDPENLQAKTLVHEFCGAAFGKSAPSMLEFYGQLYHGIELYSNYLGTRAPAWTYINMNGQRRKHLSDPFQMLGFLYTPSLLSALETQLAQAEQVADTEKVRVRLSAVRREFEYLKALAKVVHLHQAYQIQPDLVSRGRLLDAIDDRNAFVDSLFVRPDSKIQPTVAWSFVMFPPLGHDANHLRLAYDGYQEPYANTPLNWDTQAMRLAPLPGAKRLSAPITAKAADATMWKQPLAAPLGHRVRDTRNLAEGAADRAPATVRVTADARQLYLRIDAAAGKQWTRQDRIEVYLGPLGDKQIIYRFTVGPQPNDKQDAANGFHSDPLDPRYGRFDPDWNGDWKYESDRTNEQHWTAYLTIPFKTLGVDTPTAGSFWRGNFGIIRVAAQGEAERWLWSANSSTRVMDDPNDFGEIAFAEPADDSGKPASAQIHEGAQDEVDPASPQGVLDRMRALAKDRQWKELIEQFAGSDFSTWPDAESSEAFHRRGHVYSILKNGRQAEKDLKAAVEKAPQNAAFWLTLGDNYSFNLHDEEQALAAYRKAYAIVGPGNGWQPMSAVLGITRVLTDQVKPDEAIALLQKYDDMEGIAPVWRIKLLRAYGHAYASQGNEPESLKKFREALEWEARQ